MDGHTCQRLATAETANQALPLCREHARLKRDTAEAIAGTPAARRGECKPDPVDADARQDPDPLTAAMPELVRAHGMPPYLMPPGPAGANSTRAPVDTAPVANTAPR